MKKHRSQMPSLPRRNAKGAKGRKGKGNVRRRFDRTGDHHHNADGRPKISHLSQEVAEERARTITEAGGIPTMAYRCDSCGLWHTGRRSHN